MRAPIQTATLLVVLAVLSGCASSAGGNTRSAQPMTPPSGGIQIPIN